VIVGYGFWIFLLSDIVMFSCLFAAHAVLQTATAGGPAGRDLFQPISIAAETGLLLLSSFTCGLSAVALEARSQLWTQVALAVTGLLGLGFLLLEAPARSAARFCRRFSPWSAATASTSAPACSGSAP
jgi:cytochrome o ubiquinol oxidase subunit 3